MAPTIDYKILLDIKKYLDNGYTGKQTADKVGVSESVISRLKKGCYGEFPTFDINPELNSELRHLNLEKMRIKLSKRKVPKKKK